MEDYHSLWATILRNTTETGQRQDEEMTENSEIFHLAQMRSSHYGTQNDLDASFQNSESVWGAHDSSFVEDESTPTGSYMQSQSMP